MFDECYEPLPDTAAYLARIGLPDPQAPSLPYLDQLIYAHQTTVPFEDLDVSDTRKGVSLSIRDLFDKIMVHRRGGYCFEQNALFCSLLRALGFEVQAGMARITMMPAPHPASTHRINIVHMDDAYYLVDVGFGGPMPACALKLENGFTRTEHGQTFAARYHDQYWWDLVYEGSDGSSSPMRFSTVPAEESDFVALSFFQSRYPESYFVNTRLVNLRMPDGSRDITGSTYTERENGAVTRTEIESDEQLDELLDERFGIRNWRV